MGGGCREELRGRQLRPQYAMRRNQVSRMTDKLFPVCIDVCFVCFVEFNCIVNPRMVWRHGLIETQDYVEVDGPARVDGHTFHLY